MDQTQTLATSNEAFLALVAMACKPGTVLWTTFGAGDPYDPKFSWGGHPRALDGGSVPSNLDCKPTCGLNTYFSVSSFAANETGEVKRKAIFWDRMNVLVIDDADLTTLQGEPSYVIETSPGNHQAGIFLSADDADCRDIDLCTLLVTAMAKKGLIGDKFGNTIVRYVRLPVGANHKPRPTGAFTHQLTRWRPEVRLTLAQAAAVVGMDLEVLRTQARGVKERDTTERLNEYRESVALGQTQTPADKMSAMTKNILTGKNLHESINVLAASLVASGASGGTVINQLRALMENSAIDHDARWQERYADIGRSVTTAEAKFRKSRLETAIEAGRPAVVGQVDGEKVGSSRRPLLVKAADLVATVSAPKWVIKGMLEADALGLMYGAPGDGKSFVAIDMACSVATGTPWHGRKVRQGPVVYLAGEGQGGVSRRLAAWQKHHGVSLAGAPLFVSTRAVGLLNAQTALETVEEIERMLPDGEVPRLVVIDTVARAFVGGDENSSKEMGEFISIVDNLLKARWHAHVLLVHHTGKDASKGARGSSALKGALDQEFGIEKHIAARKIFCTKMKDAETPKEVAFKLESVHLATLTDEFGDEMEVTSAVPVMLEAADMPVSGKGGKRRVSGDLELTPRALADLIQAEGWPGLDEIQAQFGCGRSQATKAVKGAVELRLIAADGVGNRKRYVIGSGYADES